MSHSEVMKWFENYFPDYSGIGLMYGSQMEETASVSARKMVRNLYSLIIVRKIGDLRRLPVF